MSERATYPDPVTNVKKTNFDRYLEQQLKDPAFSARYKSEADPALIAGKVVWQTIYESELGCKLWVISLRPQQTQFLVLRPPSAFWLLLFTD